MKKIIEVLILIGGLMMVVSCANPSSVSDDAYSQNTNTEVQNGGGTTDDRDSQETTSTLISFVKETDGTFTLACNYIDISKKGDVVTIRRNGSSNITLTRMYVVNRYKSTNRKVISENTNGTQLIINVSSLTEITTPSLINVYLDISNNAIRITTD